MRRREFLLHMGAIILETAYFRESPDDPNKLKLEKYLSEIRPATTRHREIVEANNLFANFRNLTDEQRVNDFNMYFPMYRAGDIQNNIPWLLLWIIHVQETSVSRSVNPEINGYRGAMQRHPRFYDDKIVTKAAEEWQFLGLLPQRYSKNKGYKTNDFEEILFASQKIRNDAEKVKVETPNFTWEESVLSAQYSYCAPRYAEARIKKYLEIKPLFKTKRVNMYDLEQ